MLIFSFKPFPANTHTHCVRIFIYSFINTNALKETEGGKRRIEKQTDKRERLMEYEKDKHS